MIDSRPTIHYKTTMRKTILLVEDEAVVALAEQRRLEARGFAVVTAQRGAEAVAIAGQRGDIDLILMDIALGPEMDGIEAARAILRRTAVPLIFLTNHAEREIVERTRDIDSYGYVVRSAGPAVIDAAIATALRLAESTLREKEINAALRESEKKYRELYDNALEGIYRISSTGRLLQANAALARMLGYQSPLAAVADITDMAHQVWVDPAERARYIVALRNRRSILGYETRFRRTDRSELWVSVSARTVVDDQGRYLYHEGFIKDITERKLAERQLVENERRFSDLIEQSPIVYELYDEHGVLVRVNAAYERLWGRPRQSVVGTFNLLRSDLTNDGGRMPQLRRVFEGESVNIPRTEITARQEGGTPRRRWISTIAYPVKDESGAVRNAVVLHEDVSELNDTLEALRKSEEKFHRLFSNSPGILSVNTIDGLVFKEINERFVSATGYARHEVIGRSLRDLPLVSPHDLETLVGQMRRQGSLENHELTFITKDGTKRLGAVTVERVDFDETPHYFTIIDDITETRETDREVMTAVTEERRRIGQDLHDDLGQTLTGVSFLVQGLRQELAGTEGAAPATIDKIAALSRSAITQVRTISKMLSPVEMESGGLLAALEEMAAGLQEVFRVTCMLRGDRAVDIRDSTTATNLYYIAREAVNNAIRHGKADRIVISLVEADETLLMEIADNGTGIARDAPAGGMGLKTIDFRARMIGGTVRVGDGTEGGTCVSVTLPRQVL